MDPYTNYYVQQDGSGIAGYSGVRYQKGNGFFGRLVSGALLPLLRYLGKKALNTGANVADELHKGVDFKQALKRQLGVTSRNIAKDAIQRVQGYSQQGQGVKRKCMFQESIKGMHTPKKLKVLKPKKAKKRVRKSPVSRKTCKKITWKNVDIS